MTQGKVVRPNTTEPRMSTYLNSRGIRLGLPISGSFELTSRCNFGCKMCYVHSQNSVELEKGELTAEQWLSLASDARDMGMMFLLLTGGEPFLRKDFPLIYTELIKMGLMVSINTNASLYNEELRELFNKYPPSRLNVSLYGGSEETYANMCGNPSFAKVVSALRSMKADGLQVRLNLSITPYNFADLEAIDAISRDIGLQIKSASYMYPPVRIGGKLGCNDGRFDPISAGEAMARWSAIRDGKEKMIERARLIRENLEAQLIESCSDVEQEGVACRAGRSAFWLTWDGRMLPCGTMSIDAAYPLRDGFAAAWDEVRARVAAIRLPHECAACANRKNCNVCAAICKCETGAFDGKPEYMCEMMQSLRESTIRIADELEKEQCNENQL